MQKIKRPAPGVTAPRVLQRKNNPEVSERGASSVAIGTDSTARRCALLDSGRRLRRATNYPATGASHVRLQYARYSVSARQGRRNAGLHRFSRNSTRGFASAEETGVAVCLLPGTELVFEQNVRHRGRWFVSKKVPFSVAQFRKLNPENPHQHHDALAFPDGTTLLVNSLVRGQRARVLQLPVSATEIAAQTHFVTPTALPAQ